MTEGKIFTINQALQALRLTVCDPEEGLSRLTDCEGSTALEDFYFRWRGLSNRWRIWLPRIIMTVMTDLVLRVGRT